MKEKEEKQKGNFWLTAATFIVNKRKAIEILFILAIIYSVLSINKVQVNQDITSYLPADSETRQGLSIMDEQFVTYGSAKVMLTNVTYNQADELVSELEDIDGVKQVTFDDSSDHYKGPVVSDDELISGIAFESATFTASSALSVSCSSINLSQRIVHHHLQLYQVWLQ